MYTFLRGKRTRLLYAYMTCQVAIFIMSSGQALEILTLGSPVNLCLTKYKYIGMCYIGPIWLNFCLTYIESKVLENKIFRIGIFILPTIYYLLLLTNDYHFWFFQNDQKNSFGAAFYFHIFTVYIYAVISIALLIKDYFKQHGDAKKQALLFWLSAFVPSLINALYVIFNIGPSNFDLTPTSMTFSLLFVAIAAFKYKFLNIMPVALSKIFYYVDDIIIVVDSYNKVIDINKDLPLIKRNYDISSSLEYLKENMISHERTTEIINAIAFGSNCDVGGEIQFIGDIKHYYLVKVRPIISKKGKVLGRIISFHDITEYKKLLEEIKTKNNELLVKNRQLSEHAITVEELAVARERNRFARDLHDTLGHTMTLLITLMKVSKIECRKDHEEAERKLTEGIEIATQGLKELRRSVSGLSPGKLENQNIVEALRQLIKDSENSGTIIDFSVQGVVEYCDTAYHEVIYRICQEAITNSIRHGKACRIDIILKFTKTHVRLFIIDDGVGCKNIKKGYGISGIEERLQSINGTISYGSSGSKGFNIHVEIPVGG
ncbi:MAG TPA: histidine kinase N-terminal 7TM domain-containing protein [Clostridia bacterium]